MMDSMNDILSPIRKKQRITTPIIKKIIDFSTPNSINNNNNNININYINRQ
jgi:hypothetical protein